MLTIAIIILAAFGIAALVGGAVIALLATRSAPDGFEDQDGFHLVGVRPTPSTSGDERISRGNARPMVH